MELKPVFFSNENFSEEERRDFAFQTVNAIRESVTLAKNSTLPITYEFAFSIIYDLDQSLYHSIVSLLVSKNENEIVKYYKEKAEGLSTVDEVVEPIDLIQNELDELENNIIQKK